MVQGQAQMGRMWTIRYLFALLCLFLAIILLVVEFSVFSRKPQTTGVKHKSTKISYDVQKGYVFRGPVYGKQLKTLGLVSARQCGLSYLEMMLGNHPSVHISEEKAPLGYTNLNIFVRSIQTAKVETPNKTVVFTFPSCMNTANFFNRLGPKRPQKVVVLLCDPVKRALSEYNNFVLHSWQKHLKGRTFQQTVNDAINYIDAGVLDLDFTQDDQLFGAYLDSLRLDRNKFDKTIVSRGVYAYDLEGLIALYPRQHILFVTGKELKENPAKVMMNIQQFAALPIKLGSSNFVADKRTGLNCLYVEHEFHCAEKEDNRMINETKLDHVTTQKLERFYKPHNDKLTRLIGAKLEWK